MTDYGTTSDLTNKISQLEAKHGELPVVLLIEDIDGTEEWEIGSIEINTDSGTPIIFITNGEQIA